MYKNIENTDKGYMELLEEIIEQQDKVNEKVQYILVGMVGGSKLSDNEYKVFIERVLYKNKFKDIALTLSLSPSSVKTYYKRAINKLKNIAFDINLKIKRK